MDKTEKWTKLKNGQNWTKLKMGQNGKWVEIEDQTKMKIGQN